MGERAMGKGEGAASTSTSITTALLPPLSRADVMCRYCEQIFAASTPIYHAPVPLCLPASHPFHGCACTHQPAPTHTCPALRPRHLTHTHICIPLPPPPGLAACLGLIKEKGILRDKVRWAGRTNDKKPIALVGLDDVYTGVCTPYGVHGCLRPSHPFPSLSIPFHPAHRRECALTVYCLFHSQLLTPPPAPAAHAGGAQEDAVLQRIEAALTQRDEFGRVMTPKERFRVLCHQ